MTHDNETEGLGRRGALAALLGTAAVATAAGSARAAPASNVRGSSSLASPTASPIETTIATAPRSSYAYRTVWYSDFLPLDPSATARTFGGSGGMYAGGVMEASVEIPAGALLREVEWYVANSSGSSATFYCAIWTAADGYITLFAPTSVPSGTSALTATRTLTTGDNRGPYPAGSKIILYAPTSSTVLLNGARLAFSNGGLEADIRQTPLKVYDSTTTGGKFTAAETRTITGLGVEPGTSAAILRVIVTGSTANGSLKLYPANQAEPTVGAVTIIANAEGIGEITIPIISTRQIKVKPSRAAHVRIDLVGTLR